MFTLTQKNKIKSGVTPHTDHCYWKERITKEIESKEKRNKSNLAKFTLMRNIKYLSPEKSFNSKEVFDRDLVHLFTSYVNSKAKMDLEYELPKRIKPTTAINWTRHNNGGHIPSKSTGNYHDLFAKKSYIKPNQHKEDSVEFENILDDIKTDMRHTFSKKKELISKIFRHK